jgi:hypothetical protein
MSIGVQNWVQVDGGAKEVVKAVLEKTQFKHGFELMLMELLVELLKLLVGLDVAYEIKMGVGVTI